MATPYRFPSRVWNERNLTGWADLFAGVHRGFSPVAPGQSPDVSAETSWNYELGVRLYPGVQLELVGFINDYTNLTGQCTLSAGCDENDIGLQFNGGKALIFGAETALNHTLYLPHAMSVPIQASYTYTNAQFKSDFNSNFSQFGRVQTGDWLPYVPRHQASIQTTLEHPNIHVTVAANIRSETRSAGCLKNTERA